MKNIFFSINVNLNGLEDYKKNYIINKFGLFKRDSRDEVYILPIKEGFQDNPDTIHLLMREVKSWISKFSEKDYDVYNLGNKR